MSQDKKVPPNKVENSAKNEDKKADRRDKKKVSLSPEEWEKLKQKAAFSEEQLDRMLRLQAEFENYRKRVAKEKSELIEYALEDFIASLLPVVDNFERALASARAHEGFPALLEGVEMIYKQMQELLKKRGLVKIEALHKKFNPEEHEAVMHVESKEHLEEIVTEETLSGYRLKDKVIRPALVKVSKGFAGEESNEAIT